MRVTLLTFALAACTNESEETDTSGETGTTETGDPETDVPDPVATFTGTVTNESGAPLVGARVNFCRGQCVTAETDASGHYTMEVAPQTGSFYVREESALLDAIVPLTVAEDQTRTVDITVFAATASVPFPTTAAEVELTPGFHLTVGLDTVEPALFEELGTHVSSVELTESQLLPIEVEAAHGAFVTGYYFGPFEAVAEAGLPYTIENTYGLAANSTLVAYASSGPDLYTWLPAGNLTVSADGTMITGGSLPMLTTLVVFQAP